MLERVIFLLGPLFKYAYVTMYLNKSASVMAKRQDCHTARHQLAPCRCAAVHNVCICCSLGDIPSLWLSDKDELCH